jgi:DNA-binding protein H-NS
MKSYKNLLSEIQRLQTLAAKRRRNEVGAVIADIRQKMADYGITLDELQQRARTRAAGGNKAGAKKGRPAGKKGAKAMKRAKRTVAPKYKDPQSGATWSGRGLTPKWLAEKEKAGAKREEFLIKRK